MYLEVAVRRVSCQRCGKVKRERLDWLADNPFYTKRFVLFVGRRCRAMSIKDVAKDVHLDWHTVKGLEQQYMTEQLRRTGSDGDWDRRDCPAEGTDLPDCGQRSGAAAAHVVWRPRPL